MYKKYIVKQDGAKDCASSCLLSIIRYYGGNVSKTELDYLIKTGNDGANAYDMINAMNTLGFEGSGHRYTFEELTMLEKIPCIAHTRNNNMYHFIVIYNINNKKKYLIIMDPDTGLKKISFESFKEIYLEKILIFTPIKKIPKLVNKKSFITYLIDQISYEKKNLKTIFILSLLTIVFTLLNSFYFKVVIDNLASFSMNFLINLSIIFIVISILKNAFIYFRNKVITNIVFSIDKKINNETICHILCLPYEYFKSKPTGEIISRITDLNNVKELIINLFISLFINLFLIIISMIILLIINKTLFLVILITLTLYSFLVIIFSKINRKKIKNTQISNSEYNKNLIESFECYESFRNLSLIKKVISKLEFSYSRYIMNSKKYENSMNKQFLTKELINDISFIVTISFGVFLISKNLITLGDLILFNSLMYYFIDPVKSIIELEELINKSTISYERISDILLVSKEINEENYDSINGDIEIKNLSFDYGVNRVFSGLNLKIRKKDKLIIFGKSGCGKSTLSKILLKYLSYDVGEILINNKNIKDIDRNIINNSISYVSQNENLINDSLINNITLDRRINENEIDEILSICHVDKIIDNKSFRRNFMIEDLGFNLSGGERQKIILARALLKNSNYIILDEALSEVGLDEEKDIIKSIFKKFNEKTIIYITHKKETISLFENVYYFGKDVENVNK